MKKILANKITLLIIMGVALIFTGAACSQTQVGGGVFKSEDASETWVQKVFIKKDGRKTLTIAQYSIFDFKFDPTDSNVLYAGTKGHGVIVSKDAGDTWIPTTQTTGNIYSLDIDPIDNNIIYAVSDYYIVKTEDAGDTWDIVHTDSKRNNFTKIIVDTYNPKIIYASALSGVVYKSKDSGINWDIKFQQEEGVQDLIIRNNDTRVLYAILDRGNIYKTATGAELITEEEVVESELEAEVVSNDTNTVNDAWELIFTEEHRKAWPYAKTAKRFFIFDNEPNTIYITAQHGLLKSTDEGSSWHEVKTLIPIQDKENLKITNLKLDPYDSDIMYFTVEGTNKIHKSKDAGNKWQIIENFPSTSRITTLIINPDDPNIIYAGMEMVEDNKGLL